MRCNDDDARKDAVNDGPIKRAVGQVLLLGEKLAEVWSRIRSVSG